MDILGASGSEAFSVFCYCEGYENLFYVVFMFSLCGIIYISVEVLMTNNTIFDDVFRTMMEEMQLWVERFYSWNRNACLSWEKHVGE